MSLFTALLCLVDVLLHYLLSSVEIIIIVIMKCFVFVFGIVILRKWIFYVLIYLALAEQN